MRIDKPQLSFMFFNTYENKQTTYNLAIRFSHLKHIYEIGTANLYVKDLHLNSERKMLESENLADLVFFQMKLGTYWKVILKKT